MEAFIKQKLGNLLSEENEIRLSPVEGGYINKSYCIRSGNKQWFCKINSATKFPQLLSKEKNSLDFIERQNIIKTPEVINQYEAGGLQVLILEWIKEGQKNEGFWKKFGEQLAHLHRVSNDYFGREEDNYMGNICQTNAPSSDWINFFIHQRLMPMVKRCSEQKLLKRKHRSAFEKLYYRLPDFFDNQCKPSLVHGDLWKGNFLCNENADPVLIDPSVYFGHRAVDLGMTNMYAVNKEFYLSYNYHFPLPSNFKEQGELCNLYALLIGLSVLGKDCRPLIESTLKRFT